MVEVPSCRSCTVWAPYSAGPGIAIVDIGTVVEPVATLEIVATIETITAMESITAVIASATTVLVAIEACKLSQIEYVVVVQIVTLEELTFRLASLVVEIVKNREFDRIERIVWSDVVASVLCCSFFFALSICILKTVCTQAMVDKALQGICGDALAYLERVQMRSLRVVP